MTGRWEHLDVASLSSQSKETSLAGSMLVLVLLTIPLTTGGTITGNFCQGGGTISIEWEIGSFQFVTFKSTAAIDWELGKKSEIDLSAEAPSQLLN